MPGGHRHFGGFAKRALLCQYPALDHCCSARWGCQVGGVFLCLVSEVIHLFLGVKEIRFWWVFGSKMTKKPWEGLEITENFENGCHFSVIDKHGSCLQPFAFCFGVWSQFGSPVSPVGCSEAIKRHSWPRNWWPSSMPTMRAPPCHMVAAS